MSLLKIVGEKLPPSQRSSLEMTRARSKCPGKDDYDVEKIRREKRMTYKEGGGEMFTTFRVLYLFVRSSLCRGQHLPKIRTLFCLVHIKKRSLLTSCVF